MFAKLTLPAGKSLVVVGLDPGVETGYAVWSESEQVLVEVRTLKIHEAMDRVLHLKPDLVIFEDARQRTWYEGRDQNQKKYGAGVREGAGSVKRDCLIWEEFLTALNIPFIARGPIAKATKWDPKKFELVTGWKGRTSTHARDAAVLVYGMTSAKLVLTHEKSKARVSVLAKSRANRRSRKRTAAKNRAAWTEGLHPLQVPEREFSDSVDKTADSLVSAA